MRAHAILTVRTLLLQGLLALAFSSCLVQPEPEGDMPPADFGEAAHLDRDRDPSGWIIIPDNEGPHAPALYPPDTFELTFVGTQDEQEQIAFRCYERLAAPGICITAHCAYDGHSALYWARWCGAGETALINRPDIVAAAFHIPPLPVDAPPDQGRSIVLNPNPFWHADLLPPVIGFTGYGIKAHGAGWVMVFGAAIAPEAGTD